MKSLIYRRNTGNQIVYTTAIASLNYKLVLKNIRLYLTLEKHLKRQFLGLNEIHILYYVHISFYFVQ